ncbi:MAG TPA: o-succinylbenzoate synthase [Thermoanaerobaculia bacterium]|jgi:O-succinylbenzoate synthase|nr:o-succinylbenzoate synthase [Thermoanaerobaculia bacterium]
MLRIESITLREIALALKEPFQISSGTQSRRRILLVQVRGAGGVEGWGECTAGELPHYGPETADTAWLALREWVAPRVLGRDFAGPEEIHPVLEANFRGHNMAKAALEMAAWELTARAEGVSLSKKLGGTRDRIRVGISLGIQASPEALVDKARAALERGYRKVKIKIKPGADVEYVRAVREALGPEAPLMADANNAYSLEDTSSLEALDELGLMMIEQPLAWDDLLRHVELQKRMKTPICLDESITSVDRAADMIALKAGRIVNIKAGRVGGFRQSKAIHDLCQAHGIPVWCGGMLESGVGRAHNVALASLPNFTLPGDVSPSERYWERDIVIPEWTMDREGWVNVPVDQPGMGVRVDLDRVEDLTVRREELRAR